MLSLRTVTPCGAAKRASTHELYTLARLSPCSAATDVASCSPRCLQAIARQRASSHASVRCQVFDGLKNFMSGLSGKQQQQPQQQEEEEEYEEATMVPLDPEGRTGVDGGENAFGPLAVLMVGFMVEEVESFRTVLLDMEADMVKLIPCTRAMSEGTLLQALESEYPQYEQPPLGTRRTLFLSGMYSSELVDVVGAYKESGLPPCTFAAAVPNNVDRLVKDLVAEVNAENAVMMQRAREAEMRRQQQQAQQE